ncbi:MAG: PilZ domain-containing protein [Thermodesulfovibrionales bacterium]
MQTGNHRLSEERRGSVRHPHTSSISFTTLGNSHNLPNNVEKPAETVDVSNEGMRIESSYPSLREGSMIKVRIPIPGQQATIPVLAEVTWINEKGPESYQVGLRHMVL